MIYAVGGSTVYRRFVSPLSPGDPGLPPSDLLCCDVEDFGLAVGDVDETGLLQPVPTFKGKPLRPEFRFRSLNKERDSPQRKEAMVERIEAINARLHRMKMALEREHKLA